MAAPRPTWQVNDRLVAVQDNDGLKRDHAKGEEQRVTAENYHSVLQMVREMKHCARRRRVCERKQC